MKKLARYLELHGLTIDGFARLADLSPSIVSRLLSGHRGVTLKSAIKIERATRGQIKATECMKDGGERQMTG